MLGSVLAVTAPAYAQSSTGSVTRQMVVHKALEYNHYRYALQGSNPKTGFSCIGLVWYVFQSLGIDMPGSLSTAKAAYPTIPEADLLPGDIIFFKNTVWRGLSHVGIYIGNGRMISAETVKRGVVVARLQNDPAEGSYWQQHYLVAERPLGNAEVTSNTASKPRVEVSVTSLNLRTTHSIQSIVETVLTQGTVLYELGSWGQWLHVALASGLQGWVVEGGVSLVSSPPPPQNSRAKSRTYNVVAGVNIHAGPAVTDEVVTVTSASWRVKVLGTQGIFSHVGLTNGRTGWMETRFIVKPVPVANHPVVHRRTGTLTITAHIRTGPSLDDTIIQWVPAGTRVSILGRIPLWDHVRVSRRLSGYIYALFIKA
jgi:uncharacterized protein YgiM (DUF1202 family)